MSNLIIYDDPCFTRIGKISKMLWNSVEPLRRRSPSRLTIKGSGESICPNWWFWAIVSSEAWRSRVEKLLVPSPQASYCHLEEWASNRHNRPEMLQKRNLSVELVCRQPFSHSGIRKWTGPTLRPLVQSTLSISDPARRRLSSFWFPAISALHCEISAEKRTVSPKRAPRKLADMGIAKLGSDPRRARQLFTHIWKTAKGLDHDIPKWANGPRQISAIASCPFSH